MLLLHEVAWSQVASYQLKTLRPFSSNITLSVGNSKVKLVFLSQYSTVQKYRIWDTSITFMLTLQFHTFYTTQHKKVKINSKISMSYQICCYNFKHGRISLQMFTAHHFFNGPSISKQRNANNCSDSLHLQDSLKENSSITISQGLSFPP